MEKLTGKKPTRTWLGIVLATAAAIAVVMALVVDLMQWTGGGPSALRFVGTVVLIKLGLFAFWPKFSRMGSEASTILHGVFHDGSLGERHDQVELWGQKDAAAEPCTQTKRNELALWARQEKRVDMGLFAANVPTFVLSHEQVFVDWNPAFELIFGALEGVSKGEPVARWYEHLSNFKKVTKRTEKMYGEAILPLTDRERITFTSPTFGKMTFSRLLSPIIDRMTGRIIGWTVVLNINSVGRREEFFKELQERLAESVRSTRHAAAFDGVLWRWRPYRQLVLAHARSCGEARRVLDIGAHTGNLTRTLLAQGRRVTAVESSVPLLRKLRDKCELWTRRLRLVKRDLHDLAGLPAQRFDAATMMLGVHRLEDPAALFEKIAPALIRGATFSLSFFVHESGVRGMFDAVRTRLEQYGRFDELKHQLAHVIEHESAMQALPNAYVHKPDDIRQALRHAGFSLVEERQGLVDGAAMMIVARRD